MEPRKLGCVDLIADAPLGGGVRHRFPQVLWQITSQLSSVVPHLRFGSVFGAAGRRVRASSPNGVLGARHRRSRYVSLGQAGWSVAQPHVSTWKVAEIAIPAILEYRDKILLCALVGACPPYDGSHKQQYGN